MKQILLYATILAPIISALVQVAKKYTPAEGKLLPVIGIVIGVVVGGLYGATVAGDVVLHLWAGGIAGMSSVGVFELVKATTDNLSSRNDEEANNYLSRMDQRNRR